MEENFSHGWKSKQTCLYFDMYARIGKKTIRLIFFPYTHQTAVRDPLSFRPTNWGQNFPDCTPKLEKGRIFASHWAQSWCLGWLPFHLLFTPSLKSFHKSLFYLSISLTSLCSCPSSTRVPSLLSLSPLALPMHRYTAKGTALAIRGRDHPSANANDHTCHLKKHYTNDTLNSRAFRDHVLVT